MPVPQSKLARKFAAGESIESLPAASNVAASVVDGVDVLVGYGHAIYAARTDRKVVLYEGWRGHSKSTSCQLTELRKGFEAELGEDGHDESGFAFSVRDDDKMLPSVEA